MQEIKGSGYTKSDSFFNNQNTRPNTRPTLESSLGSKPRVGHTGRVPVMTLIILFSEYLKFEEIIFSRKRNFVKENK
jgi:hypothetical protein